MNNLERMKRLDPTVAGWVKQTVISRPAFSKKAARCLFHFPALNLIRGGTTAEHSIQNAQRLLETLGPESLRSRIRRGSSANVVSFQMPTGLADGLELESAPGLL